MALVRSLIFCVLAALLQFCSAASSSSPSPSTSSSQPASSLSSSAAVAVTSSAASAVATDASVLIFPGDGAYKYSGCYNETVLIPGSSGSRALAGGAMESKDGLTPVLCFQFCSQFAYAGLQYGKECWCAPYLNSLSAKLADSECNIPCDGNKSAVCGGNLKISVYYKQATAITKSSSASTWKLAIGDALALGVVGLAAVILL